MTDTEPRPVSFFVRRYGSKPYIDRAYLVERYGEDEVSKIPDAEIRRLIGHASADIDIRISPRFDIPAPHPVPEILKRIASAHVRHCYAKGTGDKKEAEAQEDYTRAMTFLREIRDGRRDIP